MNRVQTKSVLARRHALHANASTDCGLFSREVEDVSHLFFDCHVALETWSRICAWLGVSVVLPRLAGDHFEQFGWCLGGGKKLRGVLSMIWVAVVGSIWYHRNSAVFQGRAVEVERMVELIQFKTWLWRKAHSRNFTASIFEWTMNPVCYIGVA